MSLHEIGTVVVAGASAGVGRTTAIAFAKRGWNVALIARGLEGLNGACREVEQTESKAIVIPPDVAGSTAVFGAADRVVGRWGHIDVWVNDAMATTFSPFHNIEPEGFRRVTEVTYLGQVYGTMAALKYMRAQDAGTIAQVGSALSYPAIPLQSVYRGAKFAIRGFTGAIRSKLAHEPVPPIYQPEAIALEIVGDAPRESGAPAFRHPPIPW